MTDCIKLGTWNAPVPAVLLVAVSCSRTHHPYVPLCAGCYDALHRFGNAEDWEDDEARWPEPGRWWCAVCFQGDIALRERGIDVPFDVPDLLAVSEPVSL